MVVGIVEIELHLPAAHSLKDKRQILRSLIDQARRKFNISIAEVGDQDYWQSARIGAAIVGSSAKVVEQEIDRLRQFAEAREGVGDINVDIDIIRD